MTDIFDGQWICEFEFFKLTKIELDKEGKAIPGEDVEAVNPLKISVMYADTDETFYEVAVADKERKFIDLQKLMDDNSG